MQTIEIMSEHLANQIAAGEVVDRPASIVKELVENAIDAKATKIKIDVSEGGISRIKVSDNGIGMSREDALLSFLRHATSKLKHERDLTYINTMGFRGEALSSIASVASVFITTSNVAGDAAVFIHIKGGDIKSIDNTTRSIGTDIVVENLFYNTPARFKYLKTVTTEISHVADIVGRLALAHPDISFSLSHEDKELFHTPIGGTLQNVMHILYGSQVSKNLLPLNINDDDFYISGFISKPEVNRSSRSYLSILLNNRFVRSVPITQSILRAYSTLLPTGRYPVGVINILLDPQLVDVNVHPAKLEVRLSKETECCELIIKGIKSLFSKESFLPQFTNEREFKKTTQETLEFQYPDTRKSLYSIPLKETEYKQPIQNEVSVEQSAVKIIKEEQPLASDNYDFDNNVDLEKMDTAPTTVSKLPFLKPLSQVHGTYIVLQASDGFYLLDQRAAHERIYYEDFVVKLTAPLYHKELLLVPITIEVSPSHYVIVTRFLDYLKSWGLEIEEFGNNTFIVRSYPSWFPKGQAESWVENIIENLKDQGFIELSNLRDAQAKMMACKAAIKGNKSLTIDEMEELIIQLGKCDNPFTCPHGRPIFIHFSTYELEKMFKRVM